MSVDCGLWIVGLLSFSSPRVMIEYNPWSYDGRGQHGHLGKTFTRNENMVRRGCPDHTLSIERWKPELRARVEKGYYYQ